MGEVWSGTLAFAVGGVVGLLAVVMAARTAPALALAAYAFVLPFGSAVRLPFGSSAFSSLSSVVGLLVTGVLLVHLLVRRRGPRSLDASLGGWLLLLGWLVLTVLWSADPPSSIRSLVVLSSLIALHAVAVLNRFDRADLRLLEIAAVAGGLLVSVQAVVVSTTGRVAVAGSRRAGFALAEGDPNITAATLLLALVIAANWAARGASTAGRAAALVAAASIFFGIALTGSRGGLVAAVVALAVVLLLSGRARRRQAAAVVGLLVVLVPVFLFAAPAALRARLQSTDSTGRVAIWEVGVRSCSETCLVGNGVGTFGEAYRDVYLEDLRVEGFGDRPWAAHNLFLSLLVEGGILGAVLLVGSLAVLLRSCWQLPPSWRTVPVAAIVALVTANMFLTNLNFKYFWLTITYATLMAQADRAAPPLDSDRTTDDGQPVVEATPHPPPVRAELLAADPRPQDPT